MGAVAGTDSQVLEVMISGARGVGAGEASADEFRLKEEHHVIHLDLSLFSS